MYKQDNLDVIQNYRIKFTKNCRQVRGKRSLRPLIISIDGSKKDLYAIAPPTAELSNGKIYVPKQYNININPFANNLNNIIFRTIGDLVDYKVLLSLNETKDLIKMSISLRMSLEQYNLPLRSNAILEINGKKHLLKNQNAFGSTLKSGSEFLNVWLEISSLEEDVYEQLVTIDLIKSRLSKFMINKINTILISFNDNRIKLKYTESKLDHDDINHLIEIVNILKQDLNEFSSNKEFNNLYEQKNTKYGIIKFRDIENIKNGVVLFVLKPNQDPNSERTNKMFFIIGDEIKTKEELIYTLEKLIDLIKPKSKSTDLNLSIEVIPKYIEPKEGKEFYTKILEKVKKELILENQDIDLEEDTLIDLENQTIDLEDKFHFDHKNFAFNIDDKGLHIIENKTYPKIPVLLYLNPNIKYNIQKLYNILFSEVDKRKEKLNIYNLAFFIEEVKILDKDYNIVFVDPTIYYKFLNSSFLLPSPNFYLLLRDVKILENVNTLKKIVGEIINKLEELNNKHYSKQVPALQLVEKLENMIRGALIIQEECGGSHEHHLEDYDEDINYRDHSREYIDNNSYGDISADVDADAE